MVTNTIVNRMLTLSWQYWASKIPYWVVIDTVIIIGFFLVGMGVLVRF